MPESDPDYLALRALARVLDDGMSTRLHYQICDQKGLAYSVSGNLLLVPRQPRSSRSTPAARTPSCRTLVGEAWRSSARFRDEPVSEAELDKAKRRFSRRPRGLLRRSRRLCGWFGGTELYARPRSQEQRARELDRVRPEDIRRAARRVIRAERLCVVVVGALDREVARKVATIVREFR